MKKVTKKIKKIMFTWIVVSLFMCKSIMPMGGPYISTVENEIRSPESQLLYIVESLPPTNGRGILRSRGILRNGILQELIDTDRKIRKNIRKNLFSNISNIGITDFIRTIERFKALFIDNERRNTSTDFSQIFKNLPDELQLNVVKYLSPTNREVFRCCSSLFRDGIPPLLENGITDRDISEYPNDIVSILIEIYTYIAINANLIISRETLIRLLAAGRNGLFTKENERILLNKYPNLININDYYLNISLQANNTSVKELAHFFYPKSRKAKRIVFLINKILSIGFGLPEILSAQSTLNIDIITSSLNLISSSGRMENFKNIGSSIYKKLKLYYMESYKESYKIYFSNPNQPVLFERERILITLLLLFIKSPVHMLNLLMRYGIGVGFNVISLYPVTNDIAVRNTIKTIIIFKILWAITTNTLYNSVLGPYEY